MNPHIFLHSLLRLDPINPLSVFAFQVRTMVQCTDDIGESDKMEYFVFT